MLSIKVLKFKLVLANYNQYYLNYKDLISLVFAPDNYMILLSDLIIFVFKQLTIFEQKWKKFRGGSLYH